MKKNLAIIGHPTRGKEVIALLEILGGNNVHKLDGNTSGAYYVIEGLEREIRIGEYIFGDEYICLLTLEEFEEKFPYKVGDKVKYINNIFCIKSLQWDSEKNTVIYYIDADWSVGYVVEADNLQPYKEESMKDYLVTEEDYGKTLEVEQEYIDAAERLMNQLAEGTHWKCKDFDSQKMIAMFLKKNTSIITEKEDSIIVDIPKDYEFAGVDDDKQQVVFTKIQSQYPKTYEECCKVLGVNPSFDIRMLEEEESTLYFKFIDLVRCRNAYWKIAGEQMELGKPWRPSKNDNVYCIFRLKGEIVKDNFVFGDSLILEFPTEEMRDAFLDSEEIAQLIESCKELL